MLVGERISHRMNPQSRPFLLVPLAPSPHQGLAGPTKKGKGGCTNVLPKGFSCTLRICGLEPGDHDASSSPLLFLFFPGESVCFRFLSFVRLPLPSFFSICIVSRFSKPKEMEKKGGGLCVGEGPGDCQITPFTDHLPRTLKRLIEHSTLAVAFRKSDQGTLMSRDSLGGGEGGRSGISFVRIRFLDGTNIPGPSHQH